MTNRYLAFFAGTASAIALMYGQPAAAQQSAQSDQPTAASGGGGLEEVVVTARRREEKAQTVPIALTTFNTEQLAKQDIRDTLSLTNVVPGLNFATGASLAPQYTFLRGAAGVVQYFDDVPTNILAASQGFFFDTGSVQVLYGPQGTLFGLSNDAGALLFEPKHPTNDFEGYVTATLGDYGRMTFEGTVNVPIVADKLLVRIGGQFQKQDGYQHVIQQDIDLLNQDYWTGRVSVLFRPADNIQNELMVNYFNTNYLPGAFTFAGTNPAAPAAFPIPIQTLFNIFAPGTNFTALLAQQQIIGPYQVAALSFVPFQKTSQWNIVDTASWDITDNFTLKNIAGYQEIDSVGNADIDGLAADLLAGPLSTGAPSVNVQYNEELQFLANNLLNDKLSFVVGGFNQWNGSRAPNGISISEVFAGESVSGGNGNTASQTHALYAQGTYNLSDLVDGLSFTAGGRYTWDKFYTHGNSYTLAGVLTASHSQEARFRSPSYTFSIDYQWRPSTMFYLTDSRGYKTGGFNGTGFVGPFAIYKPEHLNNYELGVKSDFDFGFVGMENVKARVDFSGYYGVYTDIQVSTTGAYLMLNGAKSLATPITDVGDGDLYGWMAQFTVLPTEDLELRGNVTYNRGRYKNFQGVNAAGTGQVSIGGGVPYEIVPQYKLDGHITYHLPIDKSYGDVSLSADYSWVEQSFSTVLQNEVFQDILPGHDDLDLSLDWRDILGKDGLSARLWVTNVMENKWVNGCLCAWHVVGEYGFQPAQPRMYGATLRYEFGPESAPQAASTAAYVPPAPQPVQPAAPKSYLVFFDFDKSDLTSAGRQIVDQAAMNAPAAKVTQIAVTGHTDTVGSDEYNMRLSKRRAMSVAAELEAHGIPESEIAIVAKGKRDPLVPTGDGVREPQNRRVEIVYGGGASS